MELERRLYLVHGFYSTHKSDYDHGKDDDLIQGRFALIKVDIFQEGKKTTWWNLSQGRYCWESALNSYYELEN